MVVSAAGRPRGGCNYLPHHLWQRHVRSKLPTVRPAAPLDSGPMLLDVWVDRQRPPSSNALQISPLHATSSSLQHGRHNLRLPSRPRCNTHRSGRRRHHRLVLRRVSVRAQAPRLLGRRAHDSTSIAAVPALNILAVHTATPSVRPSATSFPSHCPPGASAFTLRAPRACSALRLAAGLTARETVRR